MIRILVEVSSGDDHFRVAFCARSIERAVDVASARYPSSEVRVVFPIEPDAFFAQDATPVAETLRLEMPVSAVG